MQTPMNIWKPQQHFSKRQIRFLRSRFKNAIKVPNWLMIMNPQNKPNFFHNLKPLILKLILTLTLMLTLILTLTLPLPLSLTLVLVGVPVGRDMKKVVFCILSKYLTSACLRHDFYVVPSSEALQKTTFFMPSGGSFSFRYLFFWTSKRKGTT